jgi:hypothetical protein
VEKEKEKGVKGDKEKVSVKVKATRVSVKDF